MSYINLPYILIISSVQRDFSPKTPSFILSLAAYTVSGTYGCPVNGCYPFKRQTKIAADDIFKSVYFYLSKKIRLDFSCESSA